MNHDEPLHPAEVLAQALNRAEAAEAELRELRIENAKLRETPFKLRDAREAQAG